MNFSNKKRVIVINALLVAALFGLISFNKEFLRPVLVNPNFLKILTGCFPNFIAAYLISLAWVSAVLVRKLKYGRLIIYLSSAAAFLILMLEELKPMWGASTHYDPFDIIASGVGALLTIVTYEIIVFSQRKN